MSASIRLTSIASHLRSGQKLKVVVTRDVGPEAMRVLLERHDLDVVVWPENRVCDRKWLLENIPGASAVLVMLSEKMNIEALDAAGPNLKVISTMSVGYEHVDLDAIAQRGIRLGYTPDVLTEAVADVTVMLALMAGRNVKETITLVDDGQWPTTSWAPFSFCGPQLSASWVAPSRTAGFIGFGRIAQATLKRLVPFGYKDCLYVTSPHATPNPVADSAIAHELGLSSVRRVTLDNLAAQSDVVFVLAPGGPTTHHIVNEAFLKKMKKTAVLVNTARGTLVDSDALAKALQKEWIYAAGLDVVEGEPNVALDHPLLKQPRCVILPHIGSATTDTRQGMATLTVNNLLGGLFDQPMPAELKVNAS